MHLSLPLRLSAFLCVCSSMFLCLSAGSSVSVCFRLSPVRLSFSISTVSRVLSVFSRCTRLCMFAWQCVSASLRFNVDAGGRLIRAEDAYRWSQKTLGCNNRKAPRQANTLRHTETPVHRQAHIPMDRHAPNALYTTDQGSKHVWKPGYMLVVNYVASFLDSMQSFTLAIINLYDASTPLII